MPVSGQRGEAEARQREIDDLTAQQGMDAATRAINDATQRMAADSRQMTIATWVGVALLVLILFLTLMANLAAVKAVWVTREIGKKQVRPYLAFKIKNISAIPSDGGSFAVEFTGKVRNSGKSPAYGTSIMFNITHAIGEAESSASKDRPWMRESGIAMNAIPSGGVTNKKTASQFKIDMTAYNSGETAFRLTYVLCYFDTFGDEHVDPIVSVVAQPNLDGSDGYMLIPDEIISQKRDEE